MSKKKQKKVEKKEQKQEDNQIQITNGELRALFIPMNFTGDPANAKFMSTPYLDLMTSEKAKDLSSKARVKLMKLDLRVSPGVKVIETARKDLLDKLCIKDKEGNPVLKPPDIGGASEKERTPEEEEKHQKMIDRIPKEKWTHDFTVENRALFDKEFEEMLNDDADIGGEKITLYSADLPVGLLNPSEMGSLNKIINFTE